MTLWKIFAVDTQFKQLRKRKLNWPAPNSYCFIAQLVEHCTGIAEVTGSNPAEAWIFFRLLFRNCLNCVSTAKIFHNVITHNRGTNPVTNIFIILLNLIPALNWSNLDNVLRDHLYGMNKKLFIQYICCKIDVEIKVWLQIDEVLHCVVLRRAVFHCVVLQSHPIWFYHRIQW